jgi:hypothetical protein
MSEVKPDYFINSKGVPSILPEKRSSKIPRERKAEKMTTNCENSIDRKNLANLAIKQNLLAGKTNKNLINQQITRNKKSCANKIQDRVKIGTELGRQESQEFLSKITRKSHLNSSDKNENNREQFTTKKR